MKAIEDQDKKAILDMVAENYHEWEKEEDWWTGTEEKIVGTAPNGFDINVFSSQSIDSDKDKDKVSVSVYNLKERTDGTEEERKKYPLEVDTSDVIFSAEVSREEMRVRCEQLEKEVKFNIGGVSFLEARGKVISFDEHTEGGYTFDVWDKKDFNREEYEDYGNVPDAIDGGIMTGPESVEEAIERFFLHENKVIMSNEATEKNTTGEPNSAESLMMRDLVVIALKQAAEETKEGLVIGTETANVKR